jgi:hypothetical protein
MRALALGFLLLALGGCATAAEQEIARMRDTSEHAGAATESCWSRARAQEGYAVLSNKLTLRYNVPPTLAQRTDTTKPTPEDRQILSDLHRDWLTPCRRATIDGSVAILPALHRTMLQYAEREDAVYAALVQGRMAWGEANTQLVAIRLEMSHSMHEIASQAAQELRRQHAHEIERRREAMITLGNALTEFANQRIEAERQRQQSQPQQTICQNVGGYLSCTTY